MYDLLLALLFFVVILSPLAINGWQEWMEIVRLRREAEEAVPGVKFGAALVD